MYFYVYLCFLQVFLCVYGSWCILVTGGRRNHTFTQDAQYPRPAAAHNLPFQPKNLLYSWVLKIMRVWTAVSSALFKTRTTVYKILGPTLDVIEIQTGNHPFTAGPLTTAFSPLHWSREFRTGTHGPTQTEVDPMNPLSGL